MLKGIFGIMFALICTSAIAEVQRGIQGHTRGDVIAVRTDSEIMAWCDFSKQIVVTQNVLCVYNGSQQTASS